MGASIGTSPAKRRCVMLSPNAGWEAYPPRWSQSLPSNDRPLSDCSAGSTFSFTPSAPRPSTTRSSSARTLSSPPRRGRSSMRTLTPPRPTRADHQRRGRARRLRGNIPGGYGAGCLQRHVALSQPGSCGRLGQHPHRYRVPTRASARSSRSRSSTRNQLRLAEYLSQACNGRDDVRTKPADESDRVWSVRHHVDLFDA